MEPIFSLCFSVFPGIFELACPLSQHALVASIDPAMRLWTDFPRLTIRRVPSRAASSRWTNHDLPSNLHPSCHAVSSCNEAHRLHAIEQPLPAKQHATECTVCLLNLQAYHRHIGQNSKQEQPCRFSDVQSFRTGAAERHGLRFAPLLLCQVPRLLRLWRLLRRHVANSVLGFGVLGSFEPWVKERLRHRDAPELAHKPKSTRPWPLSA